MKNFKTAIVLIAVIYVLFFPFVLAGFGFSYDIVSCAILSGFIVITASRFEEVAEWSLGPVKAKMNQKIDEATNIIKNTKTLAAGIAQTSLTELMAGCFGFQGGIDRFKRFELHDKILMTLKEIGFSEREIDQIVTDSMWKKGVHCIYWNAIEHVLEKRNEHGHINPQEPERMKVSAKISEKMNFSLWNVPSPTEMRNIIIENGLDIDTKLDEWLNDYQYYLNTGIIKRRDKLLKDDF